MDQGSGLKSLSGPFLVKFLGGQLTKFVVKQWQQVGGGKFFAALERFQDARRFSHGWKSPPLYRIKPL